MPRKAGFPPARGNHKHVSDRKRLRHTFRHGAEMAHDNADITTEQCNARSPYINCGRLYRAFSGEQFEGQVDLTAPPPPIAVAPPAPQPHPIAVLFMDGP
jgi:hypothetical protein